MAKRCNLTSIPDELYELMRKDGASRRETIPQTILRVLCDRYLSTSTRDGHNSDTKPTHSRHKADKFVPPSEVEAQAEVVAKGYHFSGKEFLAHYARQRWKLGNGRPMGDWKLTMVTWEENWKEKHGGDGQGAAVGRQEYDTSGNKGLVDAIKEKGW